MTVFSLITTDDLLNLEYVTQINNLNIKSCVYEIGAIFFMNEGKVQTLFSQSSNIWS